MKRKPIVASRDSKPIALPALQRAAKSALELGKQTGTLVYVTQDGKIVDLTKQALRTTKKVGDC
jgi:hypothetical protein